MTAINSAISYGTAALGVAGGLRRVFPGDSRRVSFVRDGSALISFDAVLQEGHQVEAAPTAFPIEDGSVVSDHVIIAPTELQLTGVVSDTPINTTSALKNEALVAGATTAAGPIGTLVAGAALTAASAIQGSLSPSKRAYEILRTLCQGFPNGSNPVPPTPFEVHTRLRIYKNMVIKSLQSPRDATTGGALVFNITLTEMRLVRPQSIALPLNKIPDVASIKEKLDQEDPYLAEQYEKGTTRGNITSNRVLGTAVPQFGGL